MFSCTIEGLLCVVNLSRLVILLPETNNKLLIKLSRVGVPLRACLTLGSELGSVKEQYGKELQCS